MTERHRALGDARAVWAFVQVLYRELPAPVIEAAVRRILRIPSLPPQLPPDSLDRLPEAPGVYRFFGENPLPIYIGKSVNLRERVAAHFHERLATETDLRLSQEIRRIEIEETAGELGALLREAVLDQVGAPAHNRALRRKEEAGVLALGEDGAPRFIAAADVEPSRLPGHYGPFASKRSARETLRNLAAEHALCWIRLRLERRAEGPCFPRQIKRCAGVCVGAETRAAARCAARGRACALRHSGVAGARPRVDPRGLVKRRPSRRPPRARLVLVGHRARRGRARAPHRGAAAVPRSTPTSRGSCNGRWAKGNLRLTPVRAPRAASTPDYDGLITSWSDTDFTPSTL